MINIFNVFFFLCLIAPPFLFNELEKWQKIGYMIGAGLWLINLFVGNGLLFIIAFLVLAISCIQLICGVFPIMK